jgi:hypothetical protein
MGDHLVSDRHVGSIFWDSWNIHTDAEDLLHNGGISADVVVADTNGIRIGNLLIFQGSWEQLSKRLYGQFAIPLLRLDSKQV